MYLNPITTYQSLVSAHEPLFNVQLHHAILIIVKLYSQEHFSQTPLLVVHWHHCTRSCHLIQSSYDQSRRLGTSILTRFQCKTSNFDDILNYFSFPEFCSSSQYYKYVLSVAFYPSAYSTRWFSDKRQNTCPSAIITKTWYWPPLCSTMVMAISITGANEVGPTTK